jgi:hypothetical protein
MKLSLVSVLAALFALGASASPMMRQEEEASSCTLTGTYKSGTDISSCSSVVISSLSVPAGVTLDLTKTKSGATITFQGTTTFGTKVSSHDQPIHNRFLPANRVVSCIAEMGGPPCAAHWHQPQGHGHRHP